MGYGMLGRATDHFVVLLVLFIAGGGAQFEFLREIRTLPGTNILLEAS